MGDRVSIQFIKGNGDYLNESPVLFSHWGGMDFVRLAKEYVLELKEEAEKKKGMTYPLYRLEPQTVLVDFIRMLTKGQKRVESNFYLGVSSQDGDNSDNGHWVIDLDDNTANGL